jgi:hypothetical protein
MPDLLARIDTSVGCSIKDSFASLDMAAYGYRVLFDAQWIVQRGTAIPPSPDGASWQVVHDRVGLAAWEQAWRRNNGPLGVFPAGLLDHDSVTVLAARAASIVVAYFVADRPMGTPASYPPRHNPPSPLHLAMPGSTSAGIVPLPLSVALPPAQVHKNPVQRVGRRAGSRASGAIDGQPRTLPALAQPVGLASTRSAP